MGLTYSAFQSLMGPLSSPQILNPIDRLYSMQNAYFRCDDGKFHVNDDMGNWWRNVNIFMYVNVFVGNKLNIRFDFLHVNLLTCLLNYNCCKHFLLFVKQNYFIWHVRCGYVLQRSAICVQCFLFLWIRWDGITYFKMLFQIRLDDKRGVYF